MSIQSAGAGRSKCGGDAEWLHENRKNFTDRAMCGEAVEWLHEKEKHWHRPIKYGRMSVT